MIIGLGCWKFVNYVWGGGCLCLCEWVGEDKLGGVYYSY